MFISSTPTFSLTAANCDAAAEASSCAETSELWTIDPTPPRLLRRDEWPATQAVRDAAPKPDARGVLVQPGPDNCGGLLGPPFEARLELTCVEPLGAS
mmetsp:Transcript_34035/g.66984  ORF Transcript_34035/g.66984 Transcript_34035/m.66984 type:complete len:98 (-) Transcript_34035:103-396(-)